MMKNERKEKKKDFEVVTYISSVIWQNLCFMEISVFLKWTSKNLEKKHEIN